MDTEQIKTNNINMTSKIHFLNILSCIVLLSLMLFIMTPLKGETIKADKISETQAEKNDTIQKVINAMLSMQRRAWEQGVASQALLELGEKELVILLAKDAVVNQKKDGRLGLNEGDRPVADPASNGEPVLMAAKFTGDKSLELATGRMLEFLLYKAPRTTDGIIYHNYIENMIWVDAFYMVPPFLSISGHPEFSYKKFAHQGL